MKLIYDVVEFIKKNGIFLIKDHFSISRQDKIKYFLGDSIILEKYNESSNKIFNISFWNDKVVLKDKYSRTEYVLIYDKDQILNKVLEVIESWNKKFLEPSICVDLNLNNSLIIKYHKLLTHFINENIIINRINECVEGFMIDMTICNNIIKFLYSSDDYYYLSLGLYKKLDKPEFHDLFINELGCDSVIFNNEKNFLDKISKLIKICKTI